MPSPADKGQGLGEPAYEWVALTPSDSEALAIVPRALYVGVSGDLRLVSRSGAIVTLKSAAVGYHPLRPYYILSTGTTATDIVGLY